MGSFMCAHLTAQLTMPGIVVILFFRCMRALFSPSNHKRRGLKCALAVHTMIIFSLATITTAANFDMQSISYINNRGFPGLKGSLPPGPAGYQYFLYPKAIGVVPDIAFLLTTWLADGLLASAVFKSTVEVSYASVSIALSLLRYLRQEPLGRWFPVHDVPLLFGYELELFVG